MSRAGVDVTVIVPVRNEARGVREFIQALLDQTVAPREIIIADGGSTDRTREIIKEFIDAGHPIRLIEDADALPGRGRNLAIKAATTEWVAMTDAGTRPRPDWFEKLITAASADDRAEVVFGSYEPVLSTFFEECLALAFVPPLTRVGDCAFRGPSTASLLIKRSVWERAGRFPEDLRACEDLLFFERIGAAGTPAGYAPEAVVDWEIAGSPRRVFKRFRLYSLHTLRARMGRSWHLALARMYAAALAVTVLSFAHSWLWLAAVAVGLGLRVHKSIRQRSRYLKLTRRIGLHTYLFAAALLLLIDAAALTGVIDYIREKVFRGPERTKEDNRAKLGPQVFSDKADKRRTRVSGLYFCYWSLKDPLCQTQSLAYLKRLARLGHRFALVTFEQPPYRLSRRQAAVTREELAAEGIYWYGLRYHRRFPLAATAYDCIRGVITGLYIVLRHRPGIIHSRCSIPAAMAMAVSAISRTPFLYDADCRLSEEYADNGHWSRDSLAFRITSRLEARARKHAGSIVVLSDRLRRDFIDEFGITAPIEVIPCCVDVGSFLFDAAARDARRSELAIGEKKLFVYAGKTGPRYLVAEMFQFFKAATEIVGPSRFLILTREDPALFCEAAARAGVSPEEFTVKSAAHDEVVQWLSAADCGLAFIRSSGSERGSSPIKVGEYLAAGLPVAITGAIGDYSDLIERERAGVVITRMDREGFIGAAQRIGSLMAEGDSVRERCTMTARTVSLDEIGTPRYAAVYQDLLTRDAAKAQSEIGARQRTQSIAKDEA